MKLKNPNSSPAGGFVFYFEHPKTGEEVRVPESPKVANGLSQLKSWVVQALLNNAMEIPPDLPLTAPREMQHVLHVLLHRVSRRRQVRIVMISA